MVAVSSLSGWALFGAAVRAYQIGLRQQPWSHKPWGYVISAGVWTAIGYGFYNIKDKQEELVQKRIAALVDARAKRQTEQTN